jgi:hypothetical protein
MSSLENPMLKKNLQSLPSVRDFFNAFGYAQTNFSIVQITEDVNKKIDITLFIDSFLVQINLTNDMECQKLKNSIIQLKISDRMLNIRC